MRPAASGWSSSNSYAPLARSSVSSRQRPDLTIAMPPLQLNANNMEAWRPPDAWGYVPPPLASPSSEDAVVHSHDDHRASVALDLAAMQREIKRMAAAGPQIVLMRLREEWGPSADAALYKELEMEKKRWMLSALRNMDPPPNTGMRLMSGGHKILAFFESQGVKIQSKRAIGD
jgi:hypothetical protein